VTRVTTEPELPETPEHDKLHKIADKSQVIGEFLDWLPEQGIHLARWVYDEGYDRERLVTGAGKSNTALLAEFFEIDLDKIETEKRALLEHLRALNA
jgi:hypothetical protein